MLLEHVDVALSHNVCYVGLAGDLKKAMKDGKPIIIEVTYFSVNIVCRIVGYNLCLTSFYIYLHILSKFIKWWGKRNRIYLDTIKNSQVNLLKFGTPGNWLMLIGRLITLSVSWILCCVNQRKNLLGGLLWHKGHGDQEGDLVLGSKSSTLMLPNQKLKKPLEVIC